MSSTNLSKINSVSEDSLNSLMSRWECWVSKLEKKENINMKFPNFLTTDDLESSADFWNKTIKLLFEFLAFAHSTQREGWIKFTDIVCESICAQEDWLEWSNTFKRPQAKEMKILSQKIISFKTKVLEIQNQYKDLYLIGELVICALNIFEWLFMDSNCGEIVKEYYQTVDIAANKIFILKDEVLTEWTKKWKFIFWELCEFIDIHHKTGLLWSNKGDNDIYNWILKLGNTYRTNFKKQNLQKENTSSIQALVNENKIKIHKEIVSGTIKSLLKPVQHQIGITNRASNPTPTTDDQLEDGRDYNEPAEKGMRKRLLSRGRKDHYEESNNIIFFENFDGLIKDINPDIWCLKTMLRISNCLNCTFKVSKRITSIFILNSENVRVICESCLANIEIINSTKVKVQCNGNVNMANIDSCKDILLHWSPDSAHIPVYVINSTEVKMRVVTDWNNDTEYKEYIIPEQFVFQVGEDMKLSSTVSEIYKYN